MKTGLYFSKTLIQASGLILIGIFMLTACSMTTIRPDRRIPLVTDQPYTGTYKSAHVILEYQYTYTPGGDSNSGTIDFEGQLRPTTRLAELGVRLRQLDAEGKIIDTVLLYRANVPGTSTRNLTKQVQVVPGTAALAITTTSHERGYRDGGQI